jgi:hypothetical protein
LQERYAQLPTYFQSVLLFHLMPPCPPCIAICFASLFKLPEHHMMLYPFLTTLDTLSGGSPCEKVSVGEYSETELCKQQIEVVFTATGAGSKLC